MRVSNSGIFARKRTNMRASQGENARWSKKICAHPYWNARKTQTCAFQTCASLSLMRAIKQEIAHFKRARSHTEWAQGPNLHILIQRAAIAYSLLKCVISQENFERVRQSNRKCPRNPNFPILNVAEANNNEYLIDNGRNQFRICASKQSQVYVV